MSSARVKVLTVATELGLGGGENRILNIAKFIDPQKFDHTVATLYNRDTAMESCYGSLHPEFARAGIRVVSLSLPRPRKRMSSRLLKLINTTITLLRAVWKLRCFIITHGIQIVDAHMDGVVLIAVPAAVAARVPIALTLYHVETVPPRPLLQPLRIASLRLAAGIFTDSMPRANDFTRLFPGSQPPIYTIPNGVCLGSPSKSRREVLQYFGIPEDADCIIGQVSGLVPFKGHKFLLDAAKLVLAGRKRTYILCVGFTRGADAYSGELERQARDLHISDQVRIAAYPGNIADAWNVIDIHVHASTFDSLPNAVIEGMSLAKPAVVTSVGGIPDIVEHEETGLVVPPANSGALAEAILRLLSDEQLAARLGKAAHRKYLAHFTPQSTTRRLERCLLEILSDSRPSRHSTSEDSNP